MKHEVPKGGTLDQISYCARCGAAFNDPEPCSGHRPEADDAWRGRWRIIDRWNGGAGGLVVKFVSEKRGVEGHNECALWILKHTPFSYLEATTRQGLHVERWEEKTT